MKNYIIKIVLIIVILTLAYSKSYAQWVFCSNGMGGAKVVPSLAKIVSNPKLSEQFIFAGTYGTRVYRTTDAGNNWTITSLNNRTVYSLAIGGGNLDVTGEIIFAGTYEFGVYRSTNNGNNWTQVGLNGKYVYALAMSGSTIFAGTEDYGVYFSTDNGNSWIQTSLNNRDVQCLTSSGSTIFAGTSYYGVYRSTDNGNTWTQTVLNNRDIYSLIISGNNIFAGTTTYGVYRSTDNGNTWTQTTLNNKSIISFTKSDNKFNKTEQIIFAGTGGYGVYITTNNGENWIVKNEGLPSNISVSSLLIFNNYIYTGTEGYSVWRRPLSEIIGIQNISSEIPENYELFQNYPNPFNPVTKINFSLPKAEYVKLTIYDALGREIETLVSENLNPGTYQAEWNGSNYASGVYFYRLQVGSYSETKTMMLVK